MKPPRAMNIEGIKTSQEQAISRIKELDSELEKLTSNANNDVYMPENSDVSSESSSTSESEEEIPSSMAPAEGFNERNEGPQQFLPGFGNMGDKDNKFY